MTSWLYLDGSKRSGFFLDAEASHRHFFQLWKWKPGSRRKASSIALPSPTARRGLLMVDDRPPRWREMA
jgi:hypothetical protein